MSKLVLLIEDDLDDERLTLRALRKNNVVNEVVVAYDGQEALDYLFRTGKYAETPAGPNPAVIILDLKLPKLSGLDVLRKIRERDETALIPVVVLTSTDDPKQVEEAFQAGANSFVRKPVDQGEYSEAVLSVSMYWLMLNESVAA
jgi:two-component system, response regulator